ncbi:MAG TPA: alpha/beta hydrolase-fold protein, partial [bacterium]|nr:alpha/beta hydrolase-fold protein [bacterium]
NPERRYPVVYGLDADVGFASATEVSRFLALAGEMPEVIVVGIGYGADLATWRKRRVADLTPISVEDQPGSGQAARFLDFLERELIPLIERRYRTAPNRTLWGYSHGGLFGTYALFHRPGLFQNYILGSPSYGWAEGAAFQWPAAMGKTGPLPAGVVFTSVGTAESERMIANWRAFWDAVEQARVPGLEVTRGEIDETHAGGWPHAMVKGVKAVFPVR